MKCSCVWDYCPVAKRIALKVACFTCYPIIKENSNDGQRNR